MRFIEKITRDWKFHLGDNPDAKEPGFQDTRWDPVHLPHDWSIFGDFIEDRKEYNTKLTKLTKKNLGASVAYLPGGVGWYRKIYTIPEEWKDCKVFFEFDGVYMNCDLWVNGQHAGFHPYGYTGFYFHIAKYLKWGKPNVFAIRVNNQMMNSRWYSGSGIFRNLRLLAKPQTNIGTWCTKITTPIISSASAELQIETEIHTGSSPSPPMNISYVVENQEGIQLIRLTEKLALPSNKSRKLQKSISLPDPILWSPTSPYLYTIKIQINKEGDNTTSIFFDQDINRIGIRSFHFDPNRGFFLNGENIKLKGVCNHHDLGCLGAAFNYRGRQRQLEILKKMGCNAIRTSHNPPEPELLDLCDEMGFLVMEEAFDEWTGGKRQYGYHKYYHKWWRKDLMAMVKRDRNHPSVIIWSLGNELFEQHAFLWGPWLLKRMRKFLLKFDTTRPVSVGCNNVPQANKTRFADAMDLVGYNYFGSHGLKNPNLYDVDHQKYPERVIYGSETSSAFRTRGIYHLPAEEYIFTHEDLQGTSYDNSWARWGNNAETCWQAVIERDFISGEFIWTGFDYLGEPTPYSWPAKSSYFGIIDTCGFPKDIYYYYQSQWTETPMIHLLPHWDWEEESVSDPNLVIPVWCYSNCDTVELFLNGESLGEHSPIGKNSHFVWQVKYTPGKIHAIGKNNGKIRVETNKVTATAPVQIQLEADRAEIESDGEDLAFITVTALDNQGKFHPKASNLIEFSLEGPGQIVGVDNGNPLSHESYKKSQRHLFMGKCLVVIQVTEESGSITLRASSNTLQSAETQITSIKKK